MPTYSYECRSCGEQWEGIVPYSSSPNPVCTCGGESEKIWKITPRTGYQIFPYTTTHLTGEEIEIRSASHLKELERKYNVRLRDDKAWEQEEYDGVDFKTGKQKYRQGTIPGSWKFDWSNHGI